jgi:trans-2,3-dihydro-3-hydroxyanthranilate isomerase
MGSLAFYIVDVFAEEKYAGNQLAVFRGGGALSDIEMQRIAREMNFSETTFILSEIQQDGGFDVRIFTPGAEVPFAGHPTLGTAHIIRKEIQQTNAGKILLNLKVGQIPVTFGDEADNENVYWMQQIEPVFGRMLNPELVAPVLGLAPSDMDDRFPVEEVSTGLPHIIVPLRNLKSLKRARVDKEKYFALIENAWAKPILIFCPEPHESQNDISVRMFADCFGIPEDPATGSGNGCLAGYLVRHRYWGQAKIDIRSEQGYEIGRPSLLLLRAEEQDGKIDIRVGGRAITIAKGEFV